MALTTSWGTRFLALSDGRSSPLTPRGSCRRMARGSWSPRGGESHADLVGGEIKQLLFRHLRAAKAVLEDGHGGGVVLDDQRRLHARGHLPQGGLRGRGDLGNGRIHRRARLQEHLDDADTVVGGGLYVLDVAHRNGEHAFFHGSHSFFKFVGVQPGILPDDADHRDVDGREDIRGGAQQDERCEQHQEQGGHYKRVGPAQS